MGIRFLCYKRTGRTNGSGQLAEERAFLQPEQIPLFIDAIRGRKDEIALLLGLHGLRASEIMAIRRRDIDLDSGMIYVHGAAVPDEKNNLVHKETNKNASSRRKIPIMIPRLRAVVEESELGADDLILIAKSNGALYNAVKRICENNNLPMIGVHGLRHSFASLCYHLGLSEETTMRLGGWADPGTMRKIYTHLSDQDLANQTQSISNFFAQEKPKIKNGNEIGNAV